MGFFIRQQLYFSQKSVFALERSQAPKLGNLVKKVVHLSYRSTRQNPSLKTVRGILG